MQKHRLRLFLCLLLLPILCQPAQASYTDGTYTATVRMEQFYALGSASMCDPLFHSTAYITVKGDTATLTLYVIDPIPSFPDEGTPLSNVNFQFSGKTYTASYSTSNKGSYYYSNYPSFIESAGSYPSSRVQVDLPVSALDHTATGTLVCEAYVNAVMKSTQKFFVVLSNPKSTGGTSTTTPSTSTTTPNTSTTTPSTSTTTPSTSTTPQAPSTSLGEGALSSGKYTASVAMHKYMEPDSLSMCNGLFHDKVNITVEGDKATLNLYLIDPIPSYASHGTPLKDVLFFYGEESYDTNYITETGEHYYFEEASGFITQAGAYPTTKIQVILPSVALDNTQENTLACEAFINVVMNSTQTFLVKLSDIEEGSLTPETPVEKAPEITDSPSIEDSTSKETIVATSSTSNTMDMDSSSVNMEGIDWDSRVIYVILGGFLGAILLLCLYVARITKKRREIYDWHYE